MIKLAQHPEDLGRQFVEHANAGDINALVGLYEPNATLHCGDKIAIGHKQIREFFKPLSF